MTEYFIPTAQGAAEYVEKRSRFIGEVFPIESEAQARDCIEAVKKHHYDARHHCWCYRLQGSVERYSDDGEPQGTAGQPMLHVFQMEKVENVLCVVTRYFGGILLGSGGLVRAYTQTAKVALEAAGISVVRPWTSLRLPCDYALFEQVKREVGRRGGSLGETDYGENVTLEVLLPQGEEEPLRVALRDLSGGKIQPESMGEVWKAASLSP